MDNILQKFSEYTKLGYFSRVDSDHILDLFLGLDEQGHKAIKLRGKFTPKSIKGTSSIVVNQYKNDDYNTIQFSLTDDEASALFYKFCDDLIESSRNLDDVNLGYLAITNRFFQWKKMFVSIKSDLLTEAEIMGLLGEILFLKTHLFLKYNQHGAVNGWSGQELTHKDFSYENTWYEIKSIHRSSQTVKISSIEQLESEKEGELVVYSFEKMSPEFNGITLNLLVEATYHEIESEDDKAIFFSKISLQGFAYNDYYDNFVYELNSCMRFRVVSGFPKLERACLPTAITKAQYDLSLIEIKDFEIK